MHINYSQILNWIYYYSILLIGFFLPVHTRFTGFFIATAVVSWLLVNKFKITFRSRNELQAFLSNATLYFVYALGMLHTADTRDGWSQLQLKISMIIFPLMFLTASGYKGPSLKSTSRAFVAGGIVISLILLVHATYIFYSEGGNIFFYGFLTEFLDMHPGYLSMHLSFMIILVAMELMKKGIGNPGRVLMVILLIFFTVMMVMLAVRQAILAIIIAVGVMIFFHFKRKRKATYGFALGAGLILLICLCLILFPATKKRFIALIEDFKEPYTNEHPTSINMRKEVWRTSAELIQRNPVWGVGTGDTEDVLLQQYEIKDLRWPFIDKLNAHCQFIQTTLAVGLIGLCALIWLLSFSLRIAFKSGYNLYALFLLIFILNSITESTLEKESGVVFFTFFNSLFVAMLVNTNAD